jgi:Domain of unknown function (DUF4349)
LDVRKMTNTLSPKSVWKSRTLLALSLGGMIALTSCATESSTSNAPASKVANSSIIKEGAEIAASTSPAAKADAKSADKTKNADKDTKTVATNGASQQSVPANVPKPQKPQLIKTAQVAIKLDSIDTAVTKIRETVQLKGGDIYSFQDNRTADRGDHRKASLVLKVPMNELDKMLAEIAKLGKIQSQKLDSADVTQQIVDSDARLKNLRQQEDQTRKIMERAGSINDTLNVSQNLANIREQIEQIDAQVKNMRQQVAYSTINLELEELQAANPDGDPVGLRIQETWKNSTGNAAGLATNIALTMLWLLPFTPLLAAGGAGIYWWQRRKKAALAIKTELPNEEVA